MAGGKVFLVGAGPGAWELISVRGLKCLQNADVVIYDNLASPSLLKHVRDDAELIYVGKKAGQHTLDQESINQLLIEKAVAGKIVVRLKGGDPFIFGRGGEEALALAASSIAFEIVPGITAGAAVPAYAGIPVTHRRMTSTVEFITGHEAAKEKSGIDWSRIAPGPGTLVFYMGIKNLNHIVSNLVKNGRNKNCPAAVIRWGATPAQKTVTAPLEDIVQAAAKKKITPPAILVVGEVVTLRKKLNWFESKPLFGKKIIVTRSRTQASKMVEQLEQLGAEAIELPTITIEFPEKADLFDSEIARIKEFDWLVFSSTNGVDAFFKRFFAGNRDIRKLGNIKIASIGAVTTEKIHSLHLQVDFQPRQYVAECFIEEFLKEVTVAGRKFLLVRSDKARDYIVEKLEEAGAEVTSVVGYRTVPVREGVAEILARLEAAEIDWVTLASSSTADNFFNMYRGEKTFNIASIGPVTSSTVRERGFRPDAEAAEYTIPGLVKAILEYYQEKK